ncbi:hypothetical protein [Thermomonospora catenispora]|uniref:hypothetical protein n=1 Tax=Thermomonospora catenispora TaxID=2493090 RepID=UPI001F4F7BEE|nr:hypothetical protein [Thermomonospora catenispora]
MTPGSLILLHPPRATAAAWGEVPELLRARGREVLVPDVGEVGGMRYVARASLAVAAAAPTAPLVLVGRSAAGPLLPAMAAAQRAAHRAVGGYVFVDADPPAPRAPAAGHAHALDAAPPVPADWPEAPCGYLSTAGETPRVRQARLRGWQVTVLATGSADRLAAALDALIGAL